MIIVPLIIKIIIVLIVFIIHGLGTGRIFKGAFMAFFVFLLLTPTEEFIAVPILLVWGITGVIIYYLLIITMLYFLWRMK